MERKKSKVGKTKNDRIMLLSKFGLLDGLLGFKSPFEGIPILGNII